MATPEKCPYCGNIIASSRETQKVQLIPQSFYTTSWKEIVANKDKLQIGDEVRVQLKNKKVVTAVVAAVNPYHDNEVAFVFKECIKHYALDSGINFNTIKNTHGYRDSSMRKCVVNEIAKLMPDELMSVVKERTIVQKLWNGWLPFLKSYISRDKLWVPSYTEIFGIYDCRNRGTIDYGDVPFPLFDSHRSRIKYDYNGNSENYLLRTVDWLPAFIDSKSFLDKKFRYVDANGDYHKNRAEFIYAVAVGFMI